LILRCIGRSGLETPTWTGVMSWAECCQHCQTYFYRRVGCVYWVYVAHAAADSDFTVHSTSRRAIAIHSQL
jgi:hypothetical protein